jgi:hypothetical protein
MLRLILFVVSALFCILVLFCGLGNEILYSKGILKWLPFVLIFVVFPILAFQIFRLIRFKNITSYFTALSTILVGLIFGFYSDYISKEDLTKNNKKTSGVIDKRNLSIRGWRISAKFEYQGKTYYTFSKVGEYENKKLNDSVLVRFSKINPENNEIID